MKKIVLLILAFSLMDSTSYAIDKKLDRRQIYELKKECGTSAVEFSGRYRLCDGQSSYTNHYNVKLNTCLIHIKASCSKDKGDESKFWTESLIDVNENKELASYIGSNKFVGDEPPMCYVDGKQCKSLKEFQALLMPYMRE